MLVTRRIIRLSLIPAIPAAFAATTLSLSLNGCHSKTTTAADSVQSVVIGPENIVVATEGNVTNGPTISGTLTAALQATIRAQVSGSVVSTTADVGQTVSKGQVLGQLDASAIRDAYYSAKTGVTSAQNNYDLASRDLQRSETLLKAGAIAPRDLETAQQNFKNASASLDNAKAQLANAQKNLDNTHIIAPFSGAISQRSVSAGDVVQPGAALFTVVDPSSMRLDAAVPSDQLNDVHLGAEVVFTVTGYPGQDFRGKVTRISPAADPTTRQVAITIAIPNATHKLIAGLYADGRLSTRTQHGVVVPQAAIDTRLQRPGVLRLQGGHVQRADVTIGMRDDHAGLYQVTAGVSAGDTLLVAGAQTITPGTPVRVESTLATQSR